MGVIHVSVADATRDLAALLARVRAGAHIVIDDDASSPVVMRLATEPRGRFFSESLRLAKEHASLVTLDGGFERDLERAIQTHSEPLTDLWD